MSLDMRRQQIQQFYPEVHAVLQHFAAAIFERDEDTISKSELDGIDLQPALNLHILIDEGELVGFADPKLLRDYIVRHAADIVGAKWEDTEAFADELATIEHRGHRFGTPRELGSAILLVLAKDDERDIIGRIGAMAETITDEERNRTFWLLYRGCINKFFIFAGIISLSRILCYLLMWPDAQRNPKVLFVHFYTIRMRLPEPLGAI